MSSFHGSEISTIDAKGRMNVPARLRRGLVPEANDTFVIVQGLDGCAAMYPLDEWQRYAEKLRELRSGDETARAFVRRLMDTLSESKMDPQGRVMLTPRLMTLAGVEKEAKLVGALDHIEIWNAATFDQRVSQAGSSFEDMARQLFS